VPEVKTDVRLAPSGLELYLSYKAHPRWNLDYSLSPPGSTSHHMVSELHRHLSTFIAHLHRERDHRVSTPQLAHFIDPSSNGQSRAKPESATTSGSLEDAHNAACAWFLGPKAENAEYLKGYVQKILNDLTRCRQNFSPEDKVSLSLLPPYDDLITTTIIIIIITNGAIISPIQDFVDAKIASSPAFKKSMSILRTNLTFLSGLLPQHSVPFYSPRYMAHMVNDVSMPATLGYLMGLMYNPNNVTPEAGPLTHIIEYDVGQQLCRMLGFNAHLGAEPPLEGPTAWGHITCDGSVANMESMW